MTLDVDVLEYGMPGISPRVGPFLAEAAIVCPEQENHAPHTVLQVRGECDSDLYIRWSFGPAGLTCWTSAWTWGLRWHGG